MAVTKRLRSCVSSAIKFVLCLEQHAIALQLYSDKISTFTHSSPWC